MEAEGWSGTPGSATSALAGPLLRVLIAIEDGHGVYREVVGEYLRSARPHFEVSYVGLREFDAELQRLNPQVVVHAGSPEPVPDRLPCWVELSLDPGLPTEVRFGGASRRVVNPSLSYLLAVIDRAAMLCR